MFEKLFKSDTSQPQHVGKKHLPNEFKEGEVYMMQAGYHTRFPYYVMIEEVGDDFIQTTIPEKHSLKISVGSYGWLYHIPRMTYVGTIQDSKIKKLLHQPSLPTHNNK